MKKHDRSCTRWIGCLSLTAFFFCAQSARAEGLPDPLGLRASCAAPQPKADLNSLAEISPEKLAAETVEFFRRSVAATVVIEVARCGKEKDCVRTKANGTGTVVSGDGLVLTAFHVVEDATAIRAVFRAVDADGYLVLTGRTRKATVVAVSPDKDVALLRLEPDDQPFPHMAIECRWQAGQRSPLWHFGQRSGRAFGRVTFKTTSSAGIAGVYETDAAARHGDSGGPFVRASGSLVGILLSINDAGKSYYMPAADAIAALEKGIVAR